MMMDHGLTGCRALVVEDEFFIAADLTDALAGRGATVIGPVASCGEALDILSRDEAIHIAVLDVNLQGEMIDPVAAVLMARGIPFVFATGDDNSAVPASLRHITRWEKPFDPEALATTLADLAAGGWCAMPEGRRNAVE